MGTKRFAKIAILCYTKHKKGFNVVMRKTKVYLDTSVISHLLAEDTPEKMMDTRALWDLFVRDGYEIIISNVTVAELTKCNEPKRSMLFAQLNRIAYTLVEESEEALSLTDSYMKFGVLRERSRDDCRHIAVASVENCQYIISWNFKHFVNINTITKVQAVNKLLGYPEIIILPPSMLIGGLDDD